MLQINNNSIICPVVYSATGEQITEFQQFLNSNNVDMLFTGQYASFSVFGCRTIKVPQKCLKSFENLFTWVRERVSKEMSNIKRIK